MLTTHFVIASVFSGKIGLVIMHESSHIDILYEISSRICKKKHLKMLSAHLIKSYLREKFENVAHFW